MIFFLTKVFYKIWNKSVTFSNGTIIDPRAFIARNGRVIIGDGSIIRAGCHLLPSGGEIRIGNNVSVNQYCIINGYGNVVIGNNVMIAAYTCFYPFSHGIDLVELPMKNQPLKTKGGIIIKDNVWIGAHSVILDGVTINDGAVVGAGAVVTKDVPQNAIVAGVPAKIIRLRKSDDSIS